MQSNSTQQANGWNPLYQRDTPVIPQDLSRVPEEQLRRWIEDCTIVKMSVEGQLSTRNKTDPGNRRLASDAYHDWRHRAAVKLKHLDIDLLRMRGELGRRHRKQRSVYLVALLDFAEAVETWEGAPSSVKQAAGKLADVLEAMAGE